MMDSLPVHKVAGMREVIEAVGARLRYLPKYSPDLNPIEQAFSKLKAHLRKAAERTIPRLSRRIGALTARFSPQKCAHLLSTCSLRFHMTGIRSNFKFNATLAIVFFPYYPGWAGWLTKDVRIWPSLMGRGDQVQRKGVVHFAVGNMDETGDRSSQIEQRVHFDSRIGRAEIRRRQQ